MNQSNPEQFIAFLKMVAGGAAIGFIYDLTSFFLRGKENKRTASDVVFWIVSAAVVLAAFFYASELYIRVYLVAGLIAGWGIYLLVFSKPIKQFLYPLEVLGALLGKLVSKLAQMIKNALKPYASIPKNFKKSYNQYKRYFFKGRGKNGGEETKEKSA